MRPNHWWTVSLVYLFSSTLKECVAIFMDIWQWFMDSWQSRNDFSKGMCGVLHQWSKITLGNDINYGTGGATKLGEIYLRNFVIPSIERSRNFAIPSFSSLKFCDPPPPIQGMPCILYVTLYIAVHLHCGHLITIGTISDHYPMQLLIA